MRGATVEAGRTFPAPPDRKPRPRYSLRSLPRRGDGHEMPRPARQHVHEDRRGWSPFGGRRGYGGASVGMGRGIRIPRTRLGPLIFVVMLAFGALSQSRGLDGSGGAGFPAAVRDGQAGEFVPVFLADAEEVWADLFQGELGQACQPRLDALSLPPWGEQEGRPPDVDAAETKLAVSWRDGSSGLPEDCRCRRAAVSAEPSLAMAPALPPVPLHKAVEAPVECGAAMSTWSRAGGASKASADLVAVCFRGTACRKAWLRSRISSTSAM